MANFVITWTVDNTTGTSGYQAKYRLMGAESWNVDTLTGTTYGFEGLDARIYDTQVINLSTVQNNPTSAILQLCYIPDPEPVLSPTNEAVGVSFSNLSVDIDSYILTISLASTPSVIISSHTVTPEDTMEYVFTGLDAGISYIVTITPTANQFSTPYTYPFDTLVTAGCPDPINVTAVLYE